MRKLTGCILVMLTVLTMLPMASVKTAHSADLVKVRYGVSPFQDTLLPALGKEMGWYEEEAECVKGLQQLD
jgi:ABC-type nitrate/sulfonate/bicarbonate transport system substrate-binding protein